MIYVFKRWIIFLALFSVCGVSVRRIGRHFASHATIGARKGLVTTSTLHTSVSNAIDHKMGQCHPRFDLEVAVLLAGYSFDAYNEPVIRLEAYAIDLFTITIL